MLRKLIVFNLLCTVSLAQYGSPAEGFGVGPSPHQLSSVEVEQTLVRTFLDRRKLVVSDTDISILEADGSLISQPYVFANIPGLSAVEPLRWAVVAPDESFAVVGPTSAAGILRIALPAGGTQQFLLGSAMDSAVFEDADNLILGDETLPVSMILRLNLASGTTQLIGTVAPLAGSGVIEIPYVFPLILDSVGNLYVVQQLFDLFFLQTTSRILRFDRAQLNGPTPFTEAQGQTVFSNDVFLYDMDIDLSRDDLYIGTDGAILRLDVHNGDVEPVIQIDERYWKVEHLPGNPPGAMGPYQPRDTGFVRFARKEGVGFFCLYHLGDLSPKRPRLNVFNAGGGLLTRRVLNGPPNGFGFLLVGPSALFQSQETPYQNFPASIFLDPPLVLGLDLPTAHFAEGPFPLDANGRNDLIFPPPGFAQEMAAQAILFYPDLTLAGSSSPAFLQ